MQDVKFFYTGVGRFSFTVILRSRQATKNLNDSIHLLDSSPVLDTGSE